jgi:hypothetical protein
VLEECRDRRVAVYLRAAATFEDGDAAEALQLDHSGDQLQLDQVIGQLVDMQLVDVFGLPLFQC